MYEAFFGLKRRPFAATPDANCWFHCERYQAALDELLVCAEQGQGVGIIVAPAGVGKTLLCERLIREIGEPFTSVLLRHATFQSRRGFLQTLLSELAQPYDKQSDHELRLALAPVLRGLGQQGRAMLLVVDEAHLLSETLLEELRILADQAEDGKPLVRLVLCGQAGLEDKLAHPNLQALNQRVRAHVSFPALTTEESRDYLDYRLTWAGGRTDELFTPEAVNLICVAADGVPRCLNQLCDHVLLLAYVAEEHPVTVETVEQALDDLQHLPLSWNLRSSPRLDDVGRQESFVLDLEPEPATDVELTDDPDDGAGDWPYAAAEIADNDWSPADDAAEAYGEQESADGPDPADSDPAEQPSDEWCEERVIDRYAAIDAGLPVPEPETVEPAQVFDGVDDGPLPVAEAIDLFERSASDLLQAAAGIEERLEIVQHVLEYVSAGEPRQVTSQPVLEDGVTDDTEPLTASFESARDSDIESAHRTQASAAAEISPALPQASAVFEVGAEAPTATATATDAAATDATVREQVHQQPIRNLFTLLRRKQQGR